MSYLSQLLRPAMKAAVNLNDERYWTSWAPPTAAGVSVNADTALKISTVWACVGLISDCLGMLPTIIYEQMANGDRRRATEHPLYTLLHDQPNANQTAFDWKKMQTAHLLMRGNAYNYIQPGPRGFADQLIPLHPDLVTSQTLPDGRLRYVYKPLAGEQKVYTDEEIMHLRGLTLDGKTGLGVVGYARETFGTALAREQYGARYFGNGARPDGVLKTAGKLSPEGSKRMEESWNQAHRGVGKSHKIAVLEEGLEYQAMSLSNKDSQFLELGEFTAEDIAGRWFRVPPHMVGLTSKATSWGSGIEEMSMGFITYTLMPWITIWEQSISRDLILATQKYFAEFLLDALLKGRLLDRYNAYQIGRTNGWLSVNDIRRRENMSRIAGPGADEYLKPLNMTDIDDDSAPAGVAEPAPEQTQDMPMDPQMQDMPGMGPADAKGGIAADRTLTPLDRAEMVGQLVRAGYKQQDVLKLVGFSQMDDWGAPPVTLQSKSALSQNAQSPSGHLDGMSTEIPAPSAHYAALLYEAIHRVARKEYLAMSKAAKRGGDWAQAVTDFYSDHAAFVAQALAVPIERAETYAAAQALLLLEGGSAYLTGLEDSAGATLLKLTQETP